MPHVATDERKEVVASEELELPSIYLALDGDSILNRNPYEEQPARATPHRRRTVKKFDDAELDNLVSDLSTDELQALARVLNKLDRLANDPKTGDSTFTTEEIDMIGRFQDLDSSEVEDEDETDEDETGEDETGEVESEENDGDIEGTGEEENVA